MLLKIVEVTMIFTLLYLQWQMSVLLNGTLTYSALPSMPTNENKKPDEMPTSVVLTAFISSLLQYKEGDQCERLPWQFSSMESAILEMAHALQWCKGMMGLKPANKVSWVNGVNKIESWDGNRPFVYIQ